MREKRASKTAEGVAIIRALDAENPEGKRICHDDLARYMVDGYALISSKLFINSGFYALMSLGTVEYVCVREEYGDEFLRKRLRDGSTQVVLLGAGFDTRPYRIPETRNAQVFEVDHPATQSAKLKRLRKHFEQLPSNVQFVPINFDRESLEDRLVKSGYDEKQKTVFIWQGVTMYLTSEAVNSTLEFIRKNSGTGSSVIFDYFYTETLEHRMKLSQYLLKLLGEQLRFGVEKGTIESFLIERGFENVHDLSGEELASLYLTGPNKHRRITPGVAIVTAEHA